MLLIQRGEEVAEKTFKDGRVSFMRIKGRSHLYTITMQGEAMNIHTELQQVIQI